MSRRRRFQWNKEYDELVRDCSVIIKSRCRLTGARLDWGAVEQIFPAVNRNSVRQRLVTLLALPGNETYLSRLEDRWSEVWMQYRGTPQLPERNPSSVTDFDLAGQIEFLRKYIDKNALYVCKLLLS